MVNQAAGTRRQVLGLSLGIEALGKFRFSVGKKHKPQGTQGCTEDPRDFNQNFPGLEAIS